MKKIEYAVSINNSDKKDNESYVYRHPESLNRDLEKQTMENTSSLQDIIKRLNQENPDRKFIGKIFRDKGGQNERIEWKSRGEIIGMAEQFGSGLLNESLVEANTDWNMSLKFVGIWAKNSLEYVVQDFACIFYGITSIPVYDTLGQEATEFVFSQTKMQTCVLTANHAVTLCQHASKYPHLKNLIVIDPENLPEDLDRGALNVFNF